MPPSQLEIRDVPVSYSIQERLVHLFMEGDYQPADIRTQLTLALEDPDLPHAPLFLFDVSRSTALGGRSTVELQNMADFLSSVMEPFGKRMGMVASEELHFGLLRMAEVFSEQSGFEARVFRSVAEATHWLLNE